MEQLIGQLRNPVSLVLTALLIFVVVRWVIAAVRARRAVRHLEQAGAGLERMQAKFSFIARSADSFRSALNKDKLVRLVLENVLDMGGSEYGFLLLNDYARGQLVYETGRGIDRTMLKQLTFGLREGVVGEAVKAGQLQFLEPADEERRFLKDLKREALVPEAVAIVIPITVEKEVAGVVVMYCSAENRHYLEAEPELVDAVSSVAGVALGSAIQCELAILDRLTRVYNHEFFMRRVEEELQRCRRYRSPLGLLMLDIDHFKSFNDTYGHQMGDTVLREVSTAVSQQIRLVDVCGRYGGEEFGVIMPDTDQAGAAMVAERVRAAIESAAFGGRRQDPLHVTVSIGVSAWEWPVAEKLKREELIDRADKQLYRAKRDGRNRVCVQGTN